jgi:hypothetical protein
VLDLQRTKNLCPQEMDSNGRSSRQAFRKFSKYVSALKQEEMIHAHAAAARSTKIATVAN